MSTCKVLSAGVAGGPRAGEADAAPRRHMMAASWRRLVLLGMVTLLPSHGGAAGSCSIVDGACICEDGSGNEWDVTELTAGAGSGASQVVATGACSGSYW